MEPRITISEYIKNREPNKIALVDTGIENNLLLFHYISTPETDIVKSIRGVITDSEYNVIMPSLPYTTDIVFTGSDDCLPFLTDGSTNIYFKGLEGSIIRVYNYKGTWHISTTRKIDAMFSRWGGPEPFETLFKNAIISAYGITYDEFLSNLSIDKQYVFLLNNIEQTRIVSAITEAGPQPYLVGVFTGDELEFENFTIGSLKVKTLEKLTEYPTAMVLNGCSLQCQGLFVVSKKEGKLRLYKVITQQYNHYARLRGNTFSLEGRYLELRGGDDMNMFLEFIEVFGANLRQDLEVRILALAAYFLERYNTRFYYGKYANVEKRFYGFFMGLRAYQKGNSMLTLEDISQYFKDTHYSNLERMLSIM